MVLWRACNKVAVGKIDLAAFIDINHIYVGGLYNVNKLTKT